MFLISHFPLVSLLHQTATCLLLSAYQQGPGSIIISHFCDDSIHVRTSTIDELSDCPSFHRMVRASGGRFGFRLTKA